MTTQMIWNSTKWALEYHLSKKNFLNKKLAKKIYIFDSIFFNIKKKKQTKNLNANSMNLSNTILTLSYINP